MGGAVRSVSSRTKLAKIHPARLALAADGTLLVNVDWLGPERPWSDMLRDALAHGGPVFLGVVARSDDVRRYVVPALRDAERSAAAHLGGRRRRNK